MCEGNWVESNSREVDWSGWEECTVKRYLEWNYTGSYSVLESSGKPKPPPVRGRRRRLPESTVEESHLHTLPPLTLTPLYACFTSLPSSKHDDTILDKGDFSAISMAHAKLYVLAQYTNTAALENVTLGRLHRILVQLIPIKDSQTVESITNLVEYVYANTNALVNSEEPMRRVISTFCAVHFFELHQQPAFQKLQHEGGDFVVDFLEKAGRLIALERKQSNEDTKKYDGDRKRFDEDRREYDEDRKRFDNDRKKSLEDRMKCDQDRKKSDENYRGLWKSYEKWKAECTSLRGKNKVLSKEVAELKKKRKK
jgi:hypothetical protein